MKKGIVFGIVAMYTLVSCQKILNEDIRTEVSDNYLNTLEGFESAVNASYSFVKVFYGNQNGASLTVFGTDEFTNGGDGAYKAFNWYDANLNPRASLVTNMWNNAYLAINTCNTVVDRAANITEMPETQKNIRVAEARFLRAQWYFILVQLFGPVHLTLSETKGTEVTASRAPIVDVYNAIVSDLEFAIQQLPPVPEAYGRATKPAAENLLAKVYLTRAGSTAKQETDYEKAAELAINVINNYDFELVSDFEKLFEQGNEKNSEVVWAVQNNSDLLSNGNGNNLHNCFVPRYYDAPGMYVDLENDQPYRRFRPTDFVLYTLFDQEHDDRFLKSFKWAWYTNLPGTYTVNGRTVTKNMGDTASFYPNVTWSQEEINKKDYVVYTPSKISELHFPSLIKFYDRNRSDIQQTRGIRDVMVYRLAETLLIAAEALMMEGNNEDAAYYLNIVRSRAAKIGNTPEETEANRAAMQVTPSQLTIDFILDERARELLGENMRWFDLVRTGKLLERVKKYNPFATGIQPFHVLRPIPQTQIDRTEGEFPQNEGYQ